MECRARVADVADADLEARRRRQHAELAVGVHVHGHGRPLQRGVVDAGDECAGVDSDGADADRLTLVGAGAADKDVVAAAHEGAAGLGTDDDVAVAVHVPPRVPPDDDVAVTRRAEILCLEAGDDVQGAVGQGVSGEDADGGIPEPSAARRGHVPER